MMHVVGLFEEITAILAAGPDKNDHNRRPTTRDPPEKYTPLPRAAMAPSPEPRRARNPRQISRPPCDHGHRDEDAHDPERQQVYRHQLTLRS